jgi:carboxymethylenebutenolidase
MNRDQMVESWERHTAYEFALKDANLAVSTMWRPSGATCCG